MCCCCCACCCKSSGAARCWGILAAILTLIESLAWLGLAIAGLELFYCNIPVSVPDFTNQQPQEIAVDALGSFVYIVYYYNYKCSLPLTLTEHGWKDDVPLPTAERTWQWSVAYIVVSGAWALASLLMLGNGICWCHGCSRRFFPGFWILTTLAAIVMDVVASIQYGLDIGAVLDHGLMTLLEPVVEPGTELHKYIEDIPRSIAAVPSVVMTVAAARAIILWVINVILFFIVIQTCRHAPTKKEEDHLEPLNRQNVLAPAPYNHHVPPIQAQSSAKSHDELLWRGGPQRNPAYIGYDEAYDNDPGPIPQRRSYLGDYEYQGDGRRNSRSSATPSELRNQMPWSYLQPDEPPPRPLSPLRRSASPEPDHWSTPSIPQTAMKLPRASIAPSAPSSQYNNPKDPYYQYPFGGQQNPRPAGNNIYLR